METGPVPITRIMRMDFERVRENDPLSLVFDRFADQGKHELIVVDDGGRFAGVIMLIDVLGCINPHMGIPSGRKTAGLLCMLEGSNQTAGDLATKPHIAIPETSTVDGALAHMARDKHPYLVVVDRKGVALGCIELSDIISFLRKTGRL